MTQGYDVAALQPHFPGYPVFWIWAKGAHLLTGSFSLGFSLVGGLATAVLIWAALRLRGLSLRSIEGLALAGILFFAPLLWLMGNRYMPDLLGTAVALLALVFLLQALLPRRDHLPEHVFGFRPALLGLALAGLLAGLRLSYLPLLLPVVIGVLWHTPRRGQVLLAGTAGVLVWLVPMILDTGLATLFDVAWAQTAGHFTDFGGTVHTNSDLTARLLGLVEGLWADGFGGWWPGRHPLTVVVGVGLLGVGTVGAQRLWRLRSPAWRRSLLWVGGGVALYAVWIFFFQNVIHKSRHVLPLLPFLGMGLAAGAVAFWQRKAWWSRIAVALFFVAYASVTLVLVHQHRSPTAIAQTKAFVDTKGERTDPLRIASVPLVNDYLRAQQVKAHYLSVEDSTDLKRLRRPPADGQTLVIGTYASVLEAPPDHVHTFYHNPYVNRMWPEVTVYVYDH